MKTLYIDCGMGAAGDMLTAALLELLPDPEGFLQKLNALGLPGVEFRREPSVKCGITGTHMTVTVHGEEEESLDDGAGHDHEHKHTREHGHEHTHEHTHGHENPHGHGHAHTHGGSLHDIEHIVRGHLPVSERVKNDVMAVYALIAEAESAVHGVPVSEIHFHEVGTMDAVADITAVCLLMETIAPAQVVVSPIHVGSGKVRCAHGLLPVPAPATAHILRDVPIYSGSIRGELCTPTGAALLRHFATRFGDMPVMRTGVIGYGMGKKDFEAANCVRVMLGETEDRGDTVVELRCNLDDMTPEALGFAMEALLAEGALDVFSTPITMKKSRPAALFTVLCREADRERMVSLLFRHTSTLGIREELCRRYTLKRRIETAETPYGAVRKKIAAGYGVETSKWEYDDLSAIARREGKSLDEIKSAIE